MFFEVTTYINNNEIKSEDIKIRSRSFYEIVNKYIRAKEKNGNDNVEEKVSNL